MTHSDAEPAFDAGGWPSAPPLSAGQRLCLMAMVALLAGAVMLWNGLTAHKAVAPSFNGGLDAAALAREALDTSALRWIAIRSDGNGYDVDFAPLLANAAGLAAVRYGVDRAVPDQSLRLPANRHLWPLPSNRYGQSGVLVPAATRFVSICVTFADGESSPVMIYPVTDAAP